MTDQIEINESVGEKHCSNCEENTEHEYFGYIPDSLINDLCKPNVWREVEMCRECGSLNVIKFEDEKTEEAEEKYVKRLVELDIIDQEDADYYLNK